MEEKQELQYGKEMCISEHMACKADVETLSAVIQEHNALLADKVRMGEV